MCTLKVTNWYGMALPYQICTWSCSCHVSPVPVPLFDVAENRSLYPYRPIAYCGICMGASLKYKWQRMKTMMSLLLTTTFYFDGLRAVVTVSLLKLKLPTAIKYVISDHYCVDYVRSSHET